MRKNFLIESQNHMKTKDIISKSFLAWTNFYLTHSLSGFPKKQTRSPLFYIPFILENFPI
ncbi:hypothetical protein A1343_06575 [Leptospira interrogans serovar Bataviae]|nr:hypothetical protein [Leptospira interrogans]MCR8646755.1 hypothetical protein [Leptospira interrogans serovar Bataviae]OAM75654.1 hypothetical protein A1343_06575 [Leptospira interrogans serovar Bataviae]QYY61962.1 hypothetical protein GR153_008380 [Leptospira interrogans serovar Bataviae]